MNAIATVNAGLVPTSMSEAMKLAEMMAGAKLVPKDLQKSPADCLMVIQQAVRWQMDPFAVAQECSVIQGKLMHSGKLVAAVVNSRGNLAQRLSFAYAGDKGDRTITVSGRLQGETEARTVDVKLANAKTNNRVWESQPDQQLMYHGCRVWARRHTPELMLGVWSPEEFDEAAQPQNNNGAVVIEHDDDPVMPSPSKRTRAEISAAAANKRAEHKRVQDDVNQITSFVELNRYKREVLTPEFMASLGNSQWAIEEMFARREAELLASSQKRESVADAPEPEELASEAPEPVEDATDEVDKPSSLQVMTFDESKDWLQGATNVADLAVRAKNEGYCTAIKTLTVKQRNDLRRFYKQLSESFNAA